MRIIPVLDVQDGIVVRGIAGRRAEYRPLVSRLTSKCEPVAVAEALRGSFGLHCFYVADLDAIAGKPPALEMYAALHERGFQLWIDAGVRDESMIATLQTANTDAIILGLETLPNWETLARAVAVLGDRVIFSLDLKHGRPLTANPEWAEATAWDIAQAALESGVRRMIVLDLAKVGMGEGIGTEAICKKIRDHFPDIEVIAGGGVCDLADLLRLEQCGVKGALVASALHDGRLTPSDLARFTGAPFVRS